MQSTARKRRERKFSFGSVGRYGRSFFAQLQLSESFKPLMVRSVPSKKQGLCQDHNYDLQGDNCQQINAVIEEIKLKLNDMTFSNHLDRVENE
uniref:Uncharacterized protein n=1 Tax=Romanomermis culicivorax TaxID=13658 RepID=A0A915J0K3_ROMCU